MKPINAEEIVRVFNGWLEEADSLAEREAIECCIDHIQDAQQSVSRSSAAICCRGSARSRLRGAGRFSALSRKPTSP